MKADNKNYYEIFDWKEAGLSEKLNEKVNIIHSSIPPDVNSFLDVGCGDGSITNKIDKKYFIIATDRSPNALRYVVKNRFCSSADSIPLPDNSFDLIFSSEMIEHLPDQVFEKSLREFKRISRKYIYLTFPNDENIEKNFVKCPDCSFIFNKIYHLRNLNLDIIKKFFPEYDIIYQTLYGKPIKKYNKFLAKIKHSIVPSSSWIPMRWTPNNRRDTMCPSCGHSFTIPYKFNLIGFLIDSLNVIISPRKPYQQFVLLKKRDVR